MDWALLGWTTLAFLLAMGVGAHALDELHGRPLADAHPARRCSPRSRRCRSRAACAIGIVVAVQRDALAPRLRRRRRFLVVAYNLELFGGAFHGGLWFAAAWGAFPVLTAYFAVGRTTARPPPSPPRPSRFAVEPGAAAALDAGARSSGGASSRSTGEVRLEDGTTLPVDAELLARAPEAALQALAAAAWRC